MNCSSPRFSYYSRPARTSQAAATVDATDDESFANARQRPQYTSLNRVRPATTEPSPVDYDYDSASGVSPANRLNYVTIERRRPATTEPEKTESSTQASGGLEYVTLKRSGSRRTTPSTPVDDELPNLISVDSSSFRQRPERRQTTPEPTTTTTTTTTTPRPARIVVPDTVLNPVDLRPNFNLNLDPRKRQRPQTETGADTIDYENYYYYYDDVLEDPVVESPLDTEPVESLPEVTVEEQTIAVEEQTTTSSTTEATTTVNLLAEFPAFANVADQNTDDEKILEEETRYRFRLLVELFSDASVSTNNF